MLEVRENLYFFKLEFSNLWLISGMQVLIKYKIQAQYLQNHA